jgi:hypothetical protein
MNKKIIIVNETTLIDYYVSTGVTAYDAYLCNVITELTNVALNQPCLHLEE